MLVDFDNDGYPDLYVTQFGANIIILEPGAMSSMRHWHLHEDEFVMVTEGTVTLAEDGGETEMQAGDCAAFPAGARNGHHFINRSGAQARFLVVGSRAASEYVEYPDDDMKLTMTPDAYEFTRMDGTPLPGGKGDAKN